MSEDLLLDTPATVKVTAARPTEATTEAKKVSAAHATSEEALRTENQRSVNLVWETTQMRIALSVIWAALLVSVVLSVGGGVFGTPDVQLAAVVFLFGVANLVTGFYFGRTNHQRMGGVEGQTAGR